MKRLLAAGLVVGAMSPFAAAASPASPVVVTRDSLALRCSPRVVAEALLRFETAFDAGDRAGLERAFAPAGKDPPRFQWYSDGERTIRERRVLVRQLLDAHARAKLIRLLAVDIGNSWVEHSVAVGVTLTDAHGKAEVDCRTGRIYVWSVGPGTAASPCPGTPEAGILRVLLACSRTGRRPAAQELSRDFRLAATPLRLPVRCRPRAVKARVATALRAFDLAGAKTFARQFTTGANMQPYTASRPFIDLKGRAEIANFATRRAARGDGWTAVKLEPPTGTAGLPAEAIYGLTLRTTWAGTAAGAKLVLDCRTGLIARWVGPAIAPPR
jgi:hypothetical protein